MEKRVKPIISVFWEINKLINIFFKNNFSLLIINDITKMEYFTKNKQP